jgi:asparagine synthase (glutamine-hydrolysing)
MCGLVGAFSWKDTAPPPAEAEVIAARDQMWRRGQDDTGLWTSADGRMKLGFRRLAIIDLDPRSSQPMRRGRLQIIFNGEIYNFRELRRELEELGEHFETEGDAEVILALYSRFGARAPERLRGMFAFAIADEQAGTVFLARDQFGIKPLYYAEDRGTFYFASQVIEATLAS